MQTIATPNAVPATSTLPDGDALANDMIAASGSRDVAALLRRQRRGGQAVKARRDDSAPRVMFAPRGWAFNGNID